MSVASKLRRIKDVLPSETLLIIFKTLETKKVVKVREVCKLWSKLVDENRAFWKILLLPERKLEENESTVDQFDEKSGSTLEEISFVLKHKDFQNLEQLVRLILKSKQVLNLVDIKSTSLTYLGLQSLQTLSDSLLLKLPNLFDFRTSISASKVQLQWASAIKSGSLQILWIPSLQSSFSSLLHVSNPIFFQTRTSLKVEMNGTLIQLGEVFPLTILNLFGSAVCFQQRRSHNFSFLI